jgi:aminoglycoside phosphotransferase (APT) family kinase protein
MVGMLRTLAILEAERIPAPRALWSDPAGLAFGVPAIVLTRIRGGPIGRPSDPIRWAQQLGAVLARIHTLPIKEYDLSYLPPAFEVAPVFLDRALTPTRDVAAHPLAEVVLTGLRRLRDTLELKRPVFVHGDFWPGQAIWWRGQLQGIVDWDFPRLDDPGVDIGYCRMDIAIMTNPAVADEFLQAYEAATGESFRNLRFWDLLAAYQAMEHPGRWHRQGFSGMGRPDLHGVTLERKLADFVGAA